MSDQVAKPEFAIGEMLPRAWNILMQNAAPLLGGFFVVSVILCLSGWASVGLASLVLSGPLMGGYYAVALAATRGQPVEFGDVFSGFKVFLPTFLASLVISAFVFVGGVLCIIPGIIVACVYAPTLFFIMDKKMDFWPAMEASRTMVMNNPGQWALLLLIMLGLNIAGTLACCVGTLVTTPIAICMMAMAYDLETGGPEAEAVEA